MPDTATEHSGQLRRVAQHIDTVRAALLSDTGPPSPVTSARALGAIRQAHLDAVSTAATLNSGAAAGHKPDAARLSVEALGRADILVAEADRHLVSLTALTRTFDNPYGVTPRQYTASREQLRHADNALSLAAKSLRHHAERSSGPDGPGSAIRSSAQSAAARLRSALVHRPAGAPTTARAIASPGAALVTATAESRNIPAGKGR